jgi:hypothetical protein
MLFDPLSFTHQPLFEPGSALRRWLIRFVVIALLGIGGAAALLLFAPLL